MVAVGLWRAGSLRPPEGMAAAVGLAALVVRWSWAHLTLIIRSKPGFSGHSDAASLLPQAGVICSWAGESVNADDAFRLMSKGCR